MLWPLRDLFSVVQAAQVCLKMDRQKPASKSNDGGQSAIIQDFPSLSPLSLLHVEMIICPVGINKIAQDC